MKRPRSVNVASLLLWATALGATALAETTVYQFIPDQSTVTYQNWSWGYVKETRSVAGTFRLTVDSGAGVAWFDQVDAALSEEIWCLDCDDSEPVLLTKSLAALFHMTELKSTDVNDAAIKFVYERNIPTFPHADVHLRLTFMEDSVHLSGRFSEGCADCGQFDLDAVAVRKTRVLYVDTAPLIIDHNCVDLSAIPADYIAGAASLRVLMRHASVGQGIDWGLNCLGGNHPTKQACSDFVAGTYDRGNWVFELRGGNWQAKIDDLVSQVALRADDFDIFMTKLCYIDALGNRHPDWEYFRSRMEQLEADYPAKKLVWWTIPLTRDGQPGTDVFNALMRSYCAANNKILFDIADIECHDPDGTKLTNAAGDEVISQNYTKEIHAGHLNIPGRIRVASALWHLMARLAGWQKVYGTVQAAIDDANDGDVIIVNPGTYTGPGNRDIDFLGKAITVRSTDPNDPNIVAATIIDCNGTEADPHRGFRFHSGEGTDSVLDGLTITNGHAESQGGAVLCTNASSPTIISCIVTSNAAGKCGSPGRDRVAGTGGGICCAEHSDPIIDNCTISNNGIAANYSWEPSGGGVFCQYSSPIITNCTIVGNSVTGDGGGLFSDKYSNPDVTACTFTNNKADYGGGLYLAGRYQSPGITISNCIIHRNEAVHGGGVCFHRQCPEFCNCLISGNTATDSGGGISCSQSRPVFTNCTITNNGAKQYGGGIACGHGGGAAVFENCILWDNSAENGSQVSLSDCMHILGCMTMEISYTCMQTDDKAVCWQGDDGTQEFPEWLLSIGAGNVDSDPCFVDSANHDYHLKSQAGRWDPSSESLVKDDVTSPCIDAGSPMNPIGYEPFPNGGIINMGAYAGTTEASKSYFGQPVCETIIAGDINGDCKVDYADFQLMALHWLEDNR